MQTDENSAIQRGARGGSAGLGGDGDGGGAFGGGRVVLGYRGDMPRVVGALASGEGSGESSGEGGDGECISLTSNGKTPAASNEAVRKMVSPHTIALERTSGSRASLTPAALAVVAWGA